MEIILIQDVANLGYKNDIVKVRATATDATTFCHRRLLSALTRATASSWPRTSNSRLTNWLSFWLTLRLWLRNSQQR